MNDIRNKISLFIFFSTCLLLQSCENEFVINDNGGIMNSREHQLAITVGGISRAGSDEVKTAWQVDDEFGVKIRGYEEVGKYSIKDVVTGETEAVVPLVWQTSVLSEITAWYPYEGVNSMTLGGYNGAGLLIAKEYADYKTSANLTFSSPLAKVVCILKPAQGVEIDEDNTSVSFNSFIKVDYDKGVLNGIEKGDVEAVMEKSEEKLQYTVLLCPGEISSSEYFITVKSGAKTYKMFMPENTVLEGGKTYTFNITVKDRGEAAWSVSTIAGIGEERANASKISNEQDMFTTALYKPFWLSIDNSNNLFVIEYGSGNQGSVQKLNLLTKKVVTSIFRGEAPMNSEFKNFYCSTFTSDYSNFILSQDRGMGDNDLYSFAYTDGSIDISSLQKESERMTEVKGIAVSSNDKDYLFAVNKDGSLYRFKLSYEGNKIKSIGERQSLGQIQNNVNLSPNDEETSYETSSAFGRNWYDFNIQFSPDGSYAYFVSRNRNIVIKADYDLSQHTFNNFKFVAGKHSFSGGYSDGTGEDVQFKNPVQGAFDNEGNFYLCDSGNHCIRKIDSENNVTTFAGQVNKNEYMDGLLNEAAFMAPTGIVFDKENNLFYVADWNDCRIRVIYAN